MLTPNIAAVILLVVCILLLVIIPLLDGSHRFAKYISLRYTLVAVALIMALGCVLDFSHLAESSRNTVLMGGLILVGLFVVVRSLEKVKLGGKKIDIEVQKGDIKLGASLHGEQSPFANKTDNKSDSTTEKK
jgi:prepilin signal peptidase PulO-like enzyme (type II secretory pathway)